LSWLAQSGSHPKIATILARHSDVSITLDIYASIGRDEIRKAVDRLPKFTSSKKELSRLIKGKNAE
jgi:hypothetical protein